MAKINEKEIIMENLDTVDEVIELVPEDTGVDFGKVGSVLLGVGAVVAVAALGYKVYKLVKTKKAEKTQAVDTSTVVEACDFEEEAEEYAE